MAILPKYFGLVFLFYANDHRPVHVHVKHGEHENRLEFVYENGKLKDIVVKSVRGKKKLPESLLNDALRLARKKEKDIHNKWTYFFDKKGVLKCEKITKKM